MYQRVQSLNLTVFRPYYYKQITNLDLQYTASLRISALALLQCFFFQRKKTHFKMSI